MKVADINNRTIIERNFFNILRYGAFGTHSLIEPMSSFKWKRLLQMVEVQGVVPTFVSGINKYLSEDKVFFCLLYTSDAADE